MKFHREAVRLACVPDGGEVHLCSNCSQIHLLWKNLVIGMSSGEFIRFAEMIQAASENPGFGTKQPLWGESS